MFSGKIVYKKQEKTKFVSSFVGPRRERVVCERRVNIKDSGEKLSDNKNNGFEAIIPISKGTFEPHDSCFGR